MIVREFRPQDLKRVYEIEKMSFSNPYEIRMIKQLFDIGAGFLIAQDNSYVVGYIIFWIKNDNLGHIISLAVDKNYKRMQIGSRLLKTAIGIFRNFHIFNITLEVKTENKEAIEFYKTFGFEFKEKISNYYEDGSDAFKMALILIEE